jgi:hypothetical protein
MDQNTIAVSADASSFAEQAPHDQSIDDVRMIACEAVTSRRRLIVYYHGYSRVVDVYIVGDTTAGNPAMRVYQVRGGSVSGERAGWKLLRLDQVESVAILDDVASPVAAGYKASDRSFNVIGCQVSGGV